MLMFLSGWNNKLYTIIGVGRRFHGQSRLVAIVVGIPLAVYLIKIIYHLLSVDGEITIPAVLTQ
jgi:hypothetical protein